MDTARIVVTLVGLVLICLTLWFFFGVRDAAPSGSSKQATGPIYACPMHSWITSANPAANCSICGMKLVRQDNSTD